MVKFWPNDLILILKWSPWNSTQNGTRKKLFRVLHFVTSRSLYECLLYAKALFVIGQAFMLWVIQIVLKDLRIPINGKNSCIICKVSFNNISKTCVGLHPRPKSFSYRQQHWRIWHSWTTLPASSWINLEQPRLLLETALGGNSIRFLSKTKYCFFTNGYEFCKQFFFFWTPIEISCNHYLT